MKITTRCGDDAVAGLNEALLAKAAAAKLLRTDKVRADTTVVDSLDEPCLFQILQTHVFGDLDAVLTKSAVSCIGDNRNELARQLLRPDRLTC